jgi:catechol 2,3-dioxygenase-like lactoylglutathione lyase family enzyme
MVRDLYMIELSVAHWPTALAWYRDQLGLQEILRVEADQFALLQAGSGRLALKVGRPEPGTVLVTFLVDNLPAELERLERHGVVVESGLRASPEGYRRALLRDPDGYRVCLFDWGGGGPAAGAAGMCPP